MLLRTLIFSALLSLGSTAPLHAEREAREAELQARQLQYSTPGINFNYVTQECNPTQQAILKNVAISTQDYLMYADYGWERGWAWSQYWLDVNPFGPGKGNGWKHNPENVALYGNIRNSISAARLWATTGHKSGRFTELKQISYRCQEDLLKKCTNDPNRGVGAYTSHPQRTGKGWQITFCPTFFAKQAAKDVAAKGRTSSINALVTYEHILAHEYMHVGMLGHCEAIIDVNTTLLPSSDGAYAQVYGASRCKEWAWLNVPNGQDPSAYYTTASINREVVMNADNYAWYATSEYFSYLWRKHTAKKERRQISDESALFDDSTQPDYATFSIDSESGDSVNQGITFDDDNDNGDATVIVDKGADPGLSWPQNCHAPNNTNPDGELLCDYVGEQYTDHTASITPVGPAPTDLPNLNASSSSSSPTSTAPPQSTGTTCNCNEDGCTADSPACCANGSCTSQTMAAPPPASSSPAPPPYQPGTCSFHIDEAATCEDESKNLYAIVRMYDNGGSTTTPIGQTDLSTAASSTYGDHIDVGNSYSFTSKLANPLVITGEHANDYVQFTIGGQSFTSKDSNCHQGGWDPRDRTCSGNNKNGPVMITQKQGIDCSFPCPAGT